MSFSLQQKLLEQYDFTLDRDGVSGKRIASRLEAIAQIGLTEDNGSNRPGFSKEELKAKKLVIEWMKEAGLTVTTDGAGNVFGRLEGKDPTQKVILSGSHVDSVPNGGHFDGPLGVLAALEVVEAWKEEGYTPVKPFEIVIFSDEEGSRFNSGFHGSKAVVGIENIEEQLVLTDSTGLTFQEVLQSIGLTIEDYVHAKRDLSQYELFIEVHIEQGKRLEKANLPVGIVTGIAGPVWIEFSFSGEAGHAGNTPMTDRKDALVAASEFILNVPNIPREISDSAVATVGKLSVHPNGVNVIPGEVNLYVDMRDIERTTQQQLVHKVIELAENIAEKHDVNIKFEKKTDISPVPISEDIQVQLKDVLQELGIEPLYIPSGAGHDAMIIGEKLPVGMLFVKSKNGISHRPDEWTELNDCVQSVHVLKRFIEKRQ